MRVRVCLCFFVVWCRVMSCVARRCWLGGWVWCGAVDIFVVVVVFVLVSWSLSLRRHRKIEEERARKKWRKGR